MNTRLLALLAVLVLAAVGGAFWLLSGDGDAATAGASAPVQPDGGDARRATLPEAAAPSLPAVASESGELQPLTATAGAPVVSGRVVDQAGTPLADVTIELLRVVEGTALRRHRPLGFATRSDLQGRFVLAGRPGSDLALQAADGVHGPALLPLALAGNERRDLGDVVLQAGVELFGRVTSTDEQPLPGATLVLRDLGLGSGDEEQDASAEDGVEVARVQADEEGRYAVGALGKRQYTLLVEAAGHAPLHSVLSFMLHAPERFEQDFVLEPAALPLAGVVLGPDERGVPDVSLRITRRRPNTPTWFVERTRTDDQGAFRFEVLPEGHFELALVADDWYADHLPRLEAGREDHVLRVQPAIRVLGRLRAEGAPPRDFTVEVQPDARTGAALLGERPRLLEVQGSDPPGHFVLEGLRPGEYALQVQAPGFAPSRSQTLVLGGQVTQVEVLVDLQRGGELLGRVSPPEAGVRIELRDGAWDPAFALEHVFPTAPVHGLATLSDDEGAFRLACVPEGRYVLSARAAGRPPVHLRDVAVSEGGRTDVGSLDLPQGGAISGVVFGTDGHPLPRARIQITGDSHSQTTTSGADGTFRLEAVPAGSYDVQAIPREDLQLALGYQAITTVEVRTAQETLVELVFTPRPRTPPR